MSRKGFAVIVLVVLVVAGGYVLLKGNGDPSGDGVTPRITALLVLSGDYAPYGQQMERGHLLAVEHLKRKGTPVENLQALDFQAQKDKASELMRRAVSRDGVKFFAGLMGTGFVEYCAPLIDELGVLVVDGSATGDQLGGISAGFFRTIPRDGAAAAQVVKWVKDEGHGGKVLLLHSNTSWGQGLKASYEREAVAQGVTIAKAEELPQDADRSLVEAAAARCSSLKPSAVLLAITGKEAAQIFRRLKEGGETVPPMYGTDNLVGEFSEVGGQFVEGARYVFGESGEIRPEIRDLYVEMFGEPEGGSLPAYTVTGFNAMMAAAAAARATGGDPVAARGWLLEATIEGAEGPFGFEKGGEMKGVKYARKWFTAKDGKVVPSDYR